MDLLDNYKKAWENQPKEKNKVSVVEIYKMAQAKSSSIVKWIFIIGILEFTFMTGCFFLFDTSSQDEMMTKMGVKKIVDFSQCITFFIILYFLFQFYTNYKKISITDNTKLLMTKILKTRKTVRNYVVFNLLSILFISTIITYGLITKEISEFNSIPGWQIALFMFITTIIILLVFWGFYQLLYGILLKKLNKNFKELAKLDNLD